MEKDELLKEMDLLWSNFIQVRAPFPYPRKEHVGKSVLESSPFYKAEGINMKIEYEHALTKSDIERLRNLCYWINQSFLIRLYTLLEYYKLVSKNPTKNKIRKELDGHEELDILRRLRNQFAHTGKYNPDDGAQEILFNRIVKQFKIEAKDIDERIFPIPIDKVIKVIFEKVKKYVELF